MFGNIYGLDLGTSRIKVYDNRKNSIWEERSVIAIADEKNIFSVGDEAYAMYERTPENIEIVFPMKEGVISHFYGMQYLLQNLLKKGRRFARGSKYVIAVPFDVTEVEKRAYYDLVVHSTARAKEVHIVERCIADALGAGLDVQNETGIFVVNMGADTTELSVIASGGMVFNKLLKTGGFDFDASIVARIRHTYDFLIGRTTAEELRVAFDLTDNDQKNHLTAGRNLLTGIPEQKEIPHSLIREVMEEELSVCIREIRSLLERTPPVIRTSIIQHGICLTGGMARQKGLAEYIAEHLDIHVKPVKNPEIGAVNGLKKIIQSRELQKLTFSMLDESYRWIR